MDTNSQIPLPKVLEPGYIPKLVENLLYIGVLYALFYFTRYNMAAGMPKIMEHFGWAKGQMGFFETALPIIYGISVIINGPITDRIGGKKAFLWGAAGVVLANLIMGACTFLVAHPAVIEKIGSGLHKNIIVTTPAVFYHGFTSGLMLVIMLCVWTFNGFCQSFGAIAIVKINFAWVPKERRGLFSGVFGVLIRLGLILAFSGIPLIAKSKLVHLVFWVPAICVAVMAVIMGLLAKNTPQERGLKPLSHMLGQGQPDRLLQIFREFMKRLMASKTLWLFLLASAMIGFVRRGTIDTWFRTYFEEVYTGQEAAYQLAAWGIGILGIIGGFVMGWLSDGVFKKMRSPVMFIGFIGMTVFLILSGLSDPLDLGAYSAAILLCCLSFFVNGAHGILGGAVSMDLGGAKHAGSMTGMLDGAQYILASWFTGAVLGAILDHWGWEVWRWVLVPFPIFGAWLMWKRWGAENQERIKREEQAQQQA